VLEATSLIQNRRGFVQVSAVGIHGMCHYFAMERGVGERERADLASCVCAERGKTTELENIASAPPPGLEDGRGCDT